MVVGNTATEHDGLQIEFLTELLAVFIHTAAQAKSPIVGMDKHLYPIEDIPIGVVGVEGFVARHLCVSMVAFHQVVVDNDTQRAAHDAVVGHDHHLPFGKYVDELFDLLMGPKHIAAAIDSLKRTGQLIIVCHAQVAQFYFVDLLVCFHFCHLLAAKL